MSGIVSLLGIESWKPVLTALLLPPVPLLLAILIGVWFMRRRPRGAASLVVVSVIALWLLACGGFARGLESLLLEASPPMRAGRLAELRAQVASSPGETPVAIVVLGGGAEPYAPEYDGGSLEAASLERLRYGLWLARRTGCPVAFSGGLGWAGRPGVPEANLAQRIATEDFRQPLRWVENASRDTRENAENTLPLLTEAGVKRIVLVTHGWHMQRARARFEAAARSSRIRIEPAPMGLADQTQLPVLDWLPSSTGFKQSRLVIREWLGWRLGA